ncbi:MAG TPA: YihY/virulence factor BrkB family protein [Gaiellales bacterium]|jgi:YihY family inner membrane protein|nr:YihY/virulence factor BrkB family protein [Gaiellales bacterium]
MIEAVRIVDAEKRMIAGLQARHPSFALVMAVGRKYSEDRAGYLAAAIAYYAFLSIFPLMLVLVTLLGYALQGDPGMQRRVLDSALADFPVIGPQLRDNVHSLTGSAPALVIGLAVALWAGTGVCLALEHAFDFIWGVPRKRRSNFVWARLRALAWLAVLGVVTVAGGAAGALGTSTASYEVWLRLLGIGVSLALSLTIFLTSFRVLTSASPSVREVLPGAIVAAIAWEVLLTVGGYYVSHQLQHASSTYGVFALVIVLLGWLYLAAMIAVLAAELNSVLARRTPLAPGV